MRVSYHLLGASEPHYCSLSVEPQSLSTHFDLPEHLDIVVTLLISR